MTVYGFHEREVAEKLKEFARNKLAKTSSLTIQYPKPRPGASTPNRVGKPTTTIGVNATGEVALWEQVGDNVPNEISPQQLVTVINVTGQALLSTVLVEIESRANFNHPTIEPIEYSPCT